MAPHIPTVPHHSHVSIGVNAIKDILVHFPTTRDSRSDPQLTWHFEVDTVRIESFEINSSAIGNISTCNVPDTVINNILVPGQLATELTIPTDEFNVFNVNAPPRVVTFHLRELRVSRSNPF